MSVKTKENSFNLKLISKHIMDDENLPVQCHPMKPKKKKIEDVKNDSV